MRTPIIFFSGTNVGLAVALLIIGAAPWLNLLAAGIGVAAIATMEPQKS